MRLFSPAALSAGLGLALLATPLAMAQATPDQHARGMSHATMGHQMRAPTHHADAMHHPLSAMVHRQSHMQPRQASMRQHGARHAHHADMPPHDAMSHHNN
jgi:hypothetical protein